MTYNLQEAFLNLVRVGIGNAENFAVGFNEDWNALMALAMAQGLSAIILDGVERLSEDQRPPKTILLQWIGSTLQGYERRYALYRRSIAEIASFYNERGFKMMVLKGYACSLDWPKPEHRPCGDIDIWLFGLQKEADAALSKEKGILIDSSHHHHTVFFWRDFMVENHYDFVNVYHHHSNIEIDKLLKILADDDSLFVEVYDEKVYLPSPNFHAFFLLRHAMNHFASSEITIRQLLDWALFARAHRNEIDWNWLDEILSKFKMKSLYEIFNAICVEDLGFDKSFLPFGDYDRSLKTRVLNDIINPEFVGYEPKGLLSRILFKYRRWRSHAWKHQLCYYDSMWSAFWSGVRSHILKPASI